jgi:uncharacterized protein
MRRLFAILGLLACMGVVGASGTEPRPSITVSGNGKVVYVPDVGYIHVGVSSDAWTAADAWKKNEAIVKKIFEALRQYGIEERDLKTTNLSLVPRYTQKPKEEPKFAGYTASYDLNVTVHDLNLMGAVLDSMVDAGANRNLSISFGCSKLDELVDEAREKSVADARKKASLYVTGAGAKLGDVLAISDTPYQQHFYPIDAIAVREGKASLPVAQGEQEVNIAITVTWAIDNSKS